MHKSLVLSVLAAGSALAQFPNLGAMTALLDNSTTGRCHQLSMFQNMNDLMSDSKISSAAVAAMGQSQLMATGAKMMLSSMLSPLQKDTALVASCQPTVAVDNDVFSCFTVQQVDHFNTMMSNQTMVNQMTNGDATKQANMKALLAAVTDKAAALQANATLSAYCKNNVDIRCVKQKFAGKFITIASDDAAVNAHFNNNATMVANFKGFVSKAQQQLDVMKADTALQAVCAKMPSTLPVKVDSITLDVVPTGFFSGAGSPGANLPVGH